MTGKEIVEDYTKKGFDSKQIADFLRDGAALAAEGFTDDDQEAVEEAYAIVTAKTAAATLGRRGGSVKSEAKAATSRENGARGGRPAKMIYRVDVDIMESKKFSSKHAAAEYARGFDWIATIFKLDETRDDWYIIGTKLRYAKKITWQEGFLSQPQA